MEPSQMQDQYQDQQIQPQQLKAQRAAALPSKSNKRKKPIRERKGEDVEENDEEDDEADEIKPDIPEAPLLPRGGTRSSTRAMHNQTSSTSEQKSKHVEGFDWVACNKCNKWRSFPLSIDAKTFPEIWYCSMNYWDPERKDCDAPEQEYFESGDDDLFDPSDEPVKAFLRVWVKKLKNADKAETKLPPAAVTRGRKRRPDVEWIRCSNPSCGKWRAITVRGVDTYAMLKQLNSKGKWGGKNFEWYCSMNNWDETTASCAAPQESLFDAPWNLGIKEANV